MPDSPSGAADRLSFPRPPGSVSAFLRALADRRPGRLPVGATSPRIEGYIEDVRWSARLLHRYRETCGFDAGPSLPLPFPHVVASGVHLRMLLHPRFPVRLPGLVHVWHRICQPAPIEANGSLSLRSWIDGHQDSASGAEFCLHTQLTRDDEVVWSEQTGFIARSSGPRTGAARGGGGASAVGDKPGTEIARFEAPENIGRRYALASGDYNPIHLSAISARPFGFPRAIAHGMWTLARCVAELPACDPDHGVELTVRFRRPVFLPSSLTLRASEANAGGSTFRVLDEASGAICLTGRYGAPAPDAPDATG